MFEASDARRPGPVSVDRRALPPSALLDGDFCGPLGRAAEPRGELEVLEGRGWELCMGTSGLVAAEESGEDLFLHKLSLCPRVLKG